MSFERIIEASWTDTEIAVLRHEANLDDRLLAQIEEARRGYREAMESVGLRWVDLANPPAPFNWAEYEDLYTEWEEGQDYAHDEDEPDG